MFEVYTSRGASAHQLNLLAMWVRENVAKLKNGTLDVIRLIEIDLRSIFPELYVYIESDDKMKNRRAFVSSDPLGIVISESIYEGASNGCLFSSEIILHEVGHLFLHHKYEKAGLHNLKGVYKEQIQKMNASNSVEWQANTFAICALFPFDSMKNFETASEIRSKFEISDRNSIRIFSHVQKLKMRNSYRNLDKEYHWLRDVIFQLKSRTKFALEEENDVSQFSLFWPTGRVGGSALNSLC